MRCSRFACVLVLVLALPALAYAQASSADLVGHVVDSSGGVLPGVTVTVKNLGTNDSRTVTTNADGDYVFSLLPIGRYTVTIELSGFGSQTANVTLSTGDRARVDAKLQPGALTETVNVTAAAVLTQTDSATVGSLINLREVQDLPVNGRNFVRLVQSVPGANEGLPNSLASGARPDDRRQSSAVSINGAVDNQNNHLIDGMDNNERAIGTIGVKPAIDAIAEVKVQTNMYTAEVGRTAGGVINVITKSGTNQLAGSAFVFGRNDRFDAKDYFSPSKPELRQGQYGGSLGGPLRKDRTFFFVDYEGFTHTSGVTNVTTVPTLKMRNGDFSEISATIYDPTTSPRVAFDNNRIPLSRMNPIALNYLALYPLPTSSELGSNYASVTDRTQDSITTDVRIDQVFNNSASMFVRYSFNDADTFTPSGCPAVNGINPNCSTGGANRFPGPNVTTVHNVQGNFTKLWGPTLVSELRVGYLKMDIQSLPVNYGRNVSAEFGLTGVNFDDVTSGLTPINVAGFSSLGEASGNPVGFIPLIQRDDTFQLNGVVTKTHGSHNFRVGASFIARQFTVFQSAQPLGVLTFDTRLTDNGAGQGGNGLASFLLGYPSQTQRAHSLVYPRYRTDEISGFVQDDWRATDWLTLNLGVRYDIFTPFREKGNQISNFDVPSAKIIIAGRDGISETAGVATDYGSVAPRLGFAATLPGKYVARGGYGIAYFPGNMLAGSLLKNQPFVSSYGPVISSGTTGGTPSLLFEDGMPAPVPTDHVNPTGSIGAVDRKYRATRVQQFNIVVEREFRGSVVGVGYVGSRGDRVSGGVNINQAPVGPGSVASRRPYAAVLPGVSNINIQMTKFETFYDALQLVFQRRYRDGLSFNANYTFAKNQGTGAVPWDTSLTERFYSDNDIRHRAVLAANYELPFGRSLTGLPGVLLSGWQVNGILSWQSGLPFNITNSTARANTGGADRPNQIGDPDLPEDDRTPQRWFNTAAFQAQPANTIGDAVVARNSLHGPSTRRVDVSIFKNVGLGGGRRLQLRVETYNLFNTVNFATPNGALGNADFGRITGTLGTPRQMQFAAKLLF